MTSGKEHKDSEQSSSSKINLKRLTTDFIDQASKFQIPPSIKFAQDLLNKIKYPVYAPGIEAIIALQSKFPKLNSPVLTVFDMAAGIQNINRINSNLQHALSFIQNDKVSKLLDNINGLNAHVQEIVRMNSLAGPAIFPKLPNNLFNENFWKNIEFDSSLDEVSEIIEGFEGKGFPEEYSIDRIIEITRESLEESKKTNHYLSEAEKQRKGGTLREKISLLVTILTLILTAYSILNSEEDSMNNTIPSSEQKANEMRTLLSELLKESKVTTANVRLRKAPSAKDKTNIIIIIPLGSLVSVSYTSSGWSYVLYTDQESEETYYGWVSNRYLR